MNHKKIAAIGTIVLLTTGSGAAFAQMSDSASSTTEQVRITRVTKPTPIINPPAIVKESTVVGPVNVSQLASGPILKTSAPEPGSVEWMAQEKAEKDRIQSDAATTQEKLEAEIARLERVAEDTKELNQAVALVKKQVGKTWYVFSGSTPDGWDCSGLVLWMYGKIGYTLEHRASLQKHSGDIVDEPKIGDIVAFTHNGSKSAYHVGIYVGPNEMIHAGGRRGDRTEITNIGRWAKANGGSIVTYTRVIETNN
jgi:cell wall-associated NlpC family hydrolase